jgi:acyl-CoA thioester hydrolase
MKKTRKGEFVDHEIEIPIRFSEVDSMGIVWHGNYLKYFEDAREALGQKIGMGYMDVYDKGYMIPLVHSEIDYKSPIKYKDEISVKIWLKKEVAAKIVNDFEIFNKTTNKVVCTGNTVQAFIDIDCDLQLVVPEFYEKWKQTLNWTKY